MRTKTLLLTAAFSAAGLATSMAQEVFSVNSVGYVNLTVPPGFSLIANPLDNSDNTVANLLDGVPEGTAIYKFDSTTGTFSLNALDFGEWGNPGETLVPGEGAFIFNPTATDFNVTFVGEVRQGDLSTDVPAGFSILSSQVPQSAPLDSVLGYPAEEGDTVYQFDNASGQYSINAFEFGEWGGGAPEPAVGESWFMFSPSAKVWNRSFDVNNP